MATKNLTGKFGGFLQVLLDFRSMASHWLIVKDMVYPPQMRSFKKPLKSKGTTL
jgi:hypothetical protein